MFCENCGAKIADNDMFCQNCGKKVEISAAQSAPAQSVNQQEQISSEQPVEPVMQQNEAAVNSAPAPTAVLERPETTAAPAQAQNIPQQNIPQQNVPQQQMPQMNPYAQQSQQNPYAVPNNQQFAPKPQKKSNFKITKKMIIIASSVAVVLIIGIVVLMICINNANNPVNKMVEAINNGEYSEAKSIYYSNVGSIDSNNQSVIDALQSQVNAVVEEYKSGKIDYDTAVGKLDNIEKVPLSSLTDIYDVKSELIEINYSKECFEKAEDYFNDKEYSSAIYYYDSVIEEDSNYKKAQEQKAKAIDGIRQNYLDNAKKEADEHNYAYAIYDLQDGLNNEHLKNDEKLTAQINTYVDEVIKSSDEFLAAKNFDDAEDVIDNMMYVFSSGTDNYKKLEAQLEKIKKETPMQLKDIDINNSDYFYRYQSGSKDVMGNVYDSDNVCTMYVSKYSSDKGAYAEMYVKNYKKVKGTLAVKQASSSINDVTAHIEIVDDKNKVLYKSATFNNKSKPVAFEVNITDIEWLTIRLVNDKKDANGTINIILADVEFYNIGSSEPDAPAIKEETSKPETSKAESSKEETSKTESSKAEYSAESSKNESSKSTSSKEESSKTESSKAA